VPGLIYLFGAPVYVTMENIVGHNDSLGDRGGGGIKLGQGLVAIGTGLLLAAAIIKRFKSSPLKLIFGLYFFSVSIKFITGYFGIAIW
jgi:hypothetical protein